MKIELEEKIKQAKKYIEENYNYKYDFVDGYYKNIKKKNRKNGCNEFFIKLHYKKCDGIFERKYCYLKDNDRCFCCVSYNQNSFLHSQICLMAKRYYKKSETEKDIGHKGLKGKPSKYDLYIPNHKKFGNLIIEFQSRFHDYKKEEGKIKKNNTQLI